MVWLYGQHWSRRDLERHVGDMSQVGGIRPVVYQDGPERGVRALEFRSGAGLAFTVVADRGMDIGLAEWRGVPLCYQSPVGYAHPAYYEAPGMGWLRTFAGGLMVTCGLDSAGDPDGGFEPGLHGRASALPARGLAFDADWEGEAYVMRASGRMRQAAVHGENLELRRTVSAWLGENRLRIDDVVTNLGYRAEPHMIVYHFNLGFPLLSAGAEWYVAAAPAQAIGGAEATAAGTPLPGPGAGALQAVWSYETQAGRDGWVTVLVVNRNFNAGEGLALAVRYRHAELPYLWQWRCFRDGTYVLGLEPSNGDIRGRAETRRQGRLVELEPGEQRRYQLEVEVAGGAEAIGRLQTAVGNDMGR